MANVNNGNPVIPNAPPHVAIANAMPHQPTTLAELYQQMPDVYNGLYEPFLEQYSGVNAATSAELMALSLRFPTTVPNIFLYLDHLGEIGRAHV